LWTLYDQKRELTLCPNSKLRKTQKDIISTILSIFDRAGNRNIETPDGISLRKHRDCALYVAIRRSDPDDDANPEEIVFSRHIVAGKKPRGYLDCGVVTTRFVERILAKALPQLPR